jgi:hypothetical protein
VSPESIEWANPSSHLGADGAWPLQGVGVPVSAGMGVGGRGASRDRSQGGRRIRGCAKEKKDGSRIGVFPESVEAGKQSVSGFV